MFKVSLRETTKQKSTADTPKIKRMKSNYTITYYDSCMGVLDVMRWKVEQRGKRTHGHEKKVWQLWGRERYKGVNDNGKQYNKKLFKKLYQNRKS